MRKTGVFDTRTNFILQDMHEDKCAGSYNTELNSADFTPLSFTKLIWNNKNIGDVAKSNTEDPYSLKSLAAISYL